MVLGSQSSMIPEPGVNLEHSRMSLYDNNNKTETVFHEVNQRRVRGNLDNDWSIMAQH